MNIQVQPMLYAPLSDGFNLDFLQSKEWWGHVPENTIPMHTPFGQQISAVVAGPPSVSGGTGCRHKMIRLILAYESFGNPWTHLGYSFFIRIDHARVEDHPFFHLDGGPMPVLGCDNKTLIPKFEGEVISVDECIKRFESIVHAERDASQDHIHPRSRT